MKLIRYLLGLSLFLLAGQWVKADETAAESFNPQCLEFAYPVTRDCQG